MRRAKRATRRQEEEEVDREDCENFAAASPGRNLERPYRPAHAFFRIRGAFAATDFARGAEIGQAREGSGPPTSRFFSVRDPWSSRPLPWDDCFNTSSAPRRPSRVPGSTQPWRAKTVLESRGPLGNPLARHSSLRPQERSREAPPEGTRRLLLTLETSGPEATDSFRASPRAVESTRRK